MSIKNKILTGALSTAVLSTAFSLFASAQGDGNNQQGGMSLWGIIIYIVIIGALFYFLLIRPQKKRQKEEQALRDSLMLGQEITTIGGIVGKIVNIKDDNITIETSIDKTLVEFKNWAIREVKKLETDDAAPAQKKEEPAEVAEEKKEKKGLFGKKKKED